jgi:hypothetical protein
VDLKKAIYEFLVATLPAVVLYFVGWAYLYFFLGDFGINIAEIHFDTPTIFIYSFSPVQIAARAYGLWAVLGIIGAAVLAWLLVRLAKRGWRVALASLLHRLRHEASQAPVGVRICSLIVVLVLFLLALVPFLRWAAAQEKMQLWTNNSEYVVALLGAGPKSTESPPPASPWLESYKQCSDAQALLLIYADDSAYYLLCKATASSSDGYVFEVRREFGLSSVRFTSAGGQQ